MKIHKLTIRSLSLCFKNIIFFHYELFLFWTFISKRFLDKIIPRIPIYFHSNYTPRIRWISLWDSKCIISWVICVYVWYTRITVYHCSHELLFVTRLSMLLFLLAIVIQVASHGRFSSRGVELRADQPGNRHVVHWGIALCVANGMLPIRRWYKTGNVLQH